MRRIVVALPLLLSVPAMAGTFVSTPIHVAPVVHVAPVIHTAPMVHTAPAIRTTPAVHATSAVRAPVVKPVVARVKPVHAHHRQVLITTVPVAMNAGPSKPRCAQAKPDDKGCAKK
jgi:hypothetical protein